MTFTERVDAIRTLLESNPPPLPGWLKDQLQAAGADAWGQFTMPAAAALTALNRDVTHRTASGNDAVNSQAHLFAAAAACTPCPHVRRGRGPMPVYVKLPVRVAVCRRCTGTRRNPPAGEDDRCDVCGSRGNEQFIPFVAQIGHLVLAGDLGLCCEHLATTFGYRR